MAVNLREGAEPSWEPRMSAMPLGAVPPASRGQSWLRLGGRWHDELQTCFSHGMNWMSGVATARRPRSRHPGALPGLGAGGGRVSGRHPDGTGAPPSVTLGALWQSVPGHSAPKLRRGPGALCRPAGGRARGPARKSRPHADRRPGSPAPQARTRRKEAAMAAGGGVGVMSGAAAATEAAEMPDNVCDWLRGVYRFATDRNDFRRNLILNLGLFAAGVWLARNLSDIDLMAPQPGV